jgi:hypothetical protein
MAKPKPKKTARKYARPTSVAYRIWYLQKKRKARKAEN